jgi:hypothetical protein
VSCEELAEVRGGGWALESTPPHFAHGFVMKRKRLRSRGDHRQANTNVRMLAQAKRADRKDLPVGLAEDLKSRMGKDIRDDPDLDAERFLLDDLGEMRDFRAREGAALFADFFRKVASSDEAVTQEAVDIEARDEIHDRRKRRYAALRAG